MHRYATELLGTFFLVLAIGLTAVSATPGAPLAIGGMLTVMVYMGGHVSGAHYNPAVSLAVYARGKLDARDLASYVIAQLAGSILGSLTVFALTGATFAPAPGADIGTWSILLAEVLLTFALVLVIFNVANHPQTAGNSYYGLAIGLTVMAGVYAVGPISGGAFNPAVGAGPMLVQAMAADGSFVHLWFYLVGPIVGSLCAVPVFHLQLAGR